MRKIFFAHSLIWATLGVAWLAFNPFWPRLLVSSDEEPASPPRLEATLAAAPPVELRLPKLNLTTAIQTVGTTRSGQVGIPDNYTDAGWWRDSVRPGETGVALLVGHVNNYFGGPAVFTDLKTLVPGDEIFITDTSRETRRFVVTALATVPYENFDRQMVFGPYSDHAARLNLITCAGQWLPDQKIFDQRLIVSATLES